MKIPRRFLLASSALVLSAAFSSAATYYSHPKTGSAEGDGSAEKPWPVLSEMAQEGTLPQLKPGDTLLLGTGNHGNVSISGENAAPITIAAAPGHTPELGRFEITEGTNWVIKGLSISPAHSEDTYDRYIVALAEGGAGSEITLEDCFIYTALETSEWDASKWMEANSGILVGRNGKNMTLRNNYVLNTRFGISVTSSDSLIEGNVVANFSGDALRITRDNTTVRHNVLRNGMVGPDEGDDNHDDLIQCFLFNKGTGRMNNETITDNLLIGNEDLDRAHINNPQGIGFFDGPLHDFVVERNVVLTNHHHGISLYDAQNCRILDNAVMAASEQRLKPWIMLNTKNKGGSAGNTVKNNIAHSFNLKADSGVEESGNKTVTESEFKRRFKALEKAINDKFGEFHPVAKLSRVGDRVQK